MDSSLQFPQRAPHFEVALSTSLVLIGFDGKKLQILVARTHDENGQEQAILPSRYVQSTEDLTHVAHDMFHQMFGRMGPEVLEQLQAFSGVTRHPGGRVVNVAHYALVRKDLFNANRYARHNLAWTPFSQIPKLGYDHNAIVDYAKERLKRRMKRRPVGFNLLPEHFTLRQLQALYEEASNKSFDRRNFRKKLAGTYVLLDTDLVADGTQHGQRKTARLYRFNKSQYELMMKEGYDFLF